MRAQKNVDGEDWIVDLFGHKIIPLKALDHYSFGHDFGWTSPAHARPEKKQSDHAVDALRYAVMGGKLSTEPIQVSLMRRPR